MSRKPRKPVPNSTTCPVCRAQVPDIDGIPADYCFSCGARLSGTLPDDDVYDDSDEDDIRELDFDKPMRFEDLF